RRSARGFICDTHRGRWRNERRRAAPRRELRPLGGQRSGEAASVGVPHSRRRAAPRRELRPRGGQRSGRIGRERGGPAMSTTAISALPQPRVEAAWRRSVPRMLGIAILLALLAFVIFGPLANLFLWAFAEKWYFPSKLPQEFGLTFWERVFAPRGNALASLGTSVWIALLTVVMSLLVAIPAGYALARLRLRWRALILLAFLLPQ